MFAISFLSKSNFSNFLKFSFPNTFPFIKSHQDKFKYFNSLKLTFFKISKFYIKFCLKFNISNFSKFTFSNTFISDILLLFKYNSFNSFKLLFFKNSILNSLKISLTSLKEDKFF